MTFQSAHADFVHDTLGRLPSVWLRLGYVAGLRAGGRYTHWGLERIHGAEQAQAAMAQAHSEVLLEVLRGRLPRLLDEAQRAHPPVRLDLYFRELLARGDGLLPQNAGAAARTHLTAVLMSLSKLAAARASANPQAA